jgi:hypothetical protein
VHKRNLANNTWEGGWGGGGWGAKITVAIRNLILQRNHI